MTTPPVGDAHPGALGSGRAASTARTSSSASEACSTWVPVTAPGNALVIQWPPGSSPSSQTYHLIPPGDGDLLAATLPLVDRATLAPTAHPEAAWWEAVKDLTGGPAPSLAVDNGDGTIDLMIGD